MDSESIAKLAQIVDDYMGDRDMTVRDFAKKAGVSSSHVQNIKKGNFKDLQISTLAKIAEAMGFDFVESACNAKVLNFGSNLSALVVFIHFHRCDGL